MLLLISTNSIIIDRIKWNVFLIDENHRKYNPFIEHIFSLDRNILEYEVTHKCIVMNIVIDSTDSFWDLFIEYFK